MRQLWASMPPHVQRFAAVELTAIPLMGLAWFLDTGAWLWMWIVLVASWIGTLWAFWPRRTPG